MNLLGVIPARGGSKGIPKKNIQMIAGKPLIVWTIEHAKASKLLTRFVVSTDCDEIAGIARDSGAECLMRPPNLAGDFTPTVDVLKHIVAENQCDAVVLLQPTSPVRNDGRIDECIKAYIEGGHDSLATGFICKYREFGKSEPIPRQKIDGFFYDDGNIYVIDNNLVKNGKIYGTKLKKYFTSREENVEIDEFFDFWLAEQILLKRIEKKIV